jgi:DNA primase
MNTKLDNLLNVLQVVRELAPYKYQALCPAHDDQEPSLCVSLGNKDKILIHCHAGCRTEAILERLRLTINYEEGHRNG